MGFNTNGEWTSEFYPIQDRDDGTPILASKFQQLIQTDIKSGFDNCLTRDGAGKPSANLNFNGYKITNLANAEVANDALTLGQAQQGLSNYAADTSNTANAITITLTPSITAYTVGQRFYFKVANTNTLSEVSFSANGLNVCRVQMDGSDNLVPSSLKQNCMYEGIYYETGNTAEATYAGRRLQVLSQASDLAATLNHNQITNCILSAPNGVATYASLTITLAKDVRMLMYHGLNADKTINNTDYTTTAATTYTFAGTETDGYYYLFSDNTGTITVSTSNAQQTDKCIFAECYIESGAIASFTAYNAVELLKKQNAIYVVETYHNGNDWYRVWSDGWCEQGGFSSSDGEVTFLKPFASTDISFTLTSKASSNPVGANAGGTAVYELSTTKFKYSNGSPYKTGLWWEAKGYIS